MASDPSGFTTHPAAIPPSVGDTYGLQVCAPTNAVLMVFSSTTTANEGESEMISLQRVKSLLVSPHDTWMQVERESSDVAGIYKGYLALIGLIPPVSTFIGMSLVGYGGLGLSIRVPIVSGLVSMVVSYVTLLAMCYVVALIVDALAPTFGGQKNFTNAFKVAAYGSTAGIVGGIFNAVPALAMLGFIAALYSVYLFYLGLPILMKCPRDRAVGYTAVVIIAAFVAGIVVGSVSALFS